MKGISKNIVFFVVFHWNVMNFLEEEEEEDDDEVKLSFLNLFHFWVLTFY